MLEELKTYLLKNKYRLLLAAILLVAFVLRINIKMILAPLQYDEIWTIGYVGKPVWQILTDLSTPNNHPLNTLFVKLWRHCSDIPQLIRLHSLVFGMLSVLLTGALALGLFRSRAAALLSMLFIACDAAAVCYSDQARGYSAQLFFLLLFSCGIVWSGRLRKFLPWRKFLPEAAIILGAVGAVLAVPTAPIFLAAIVIAGRVYHRKFPTPAMYIAMGIAGALVAAYLGINQAGLLKARADFGKTLADGDYWIGFIIMILQDFFPLVTAPFLLVVAATDRKRALLLFFCAALILGSAAFVGAGESRVYLPLCVLVALGCGRGAHGLLTVALCRNNRKLTRILVVTAAFLAGFGYLGMYDCAPWRITDYWSWFEAGRSMPPDYLLVYPATEGYPLWWNSDRRKLELDQAERMSLGGIGARKLLCFGVAPGHINGSNPKKNGMPQEDRQLAVTGMPTTLNGFPAVEYPIHPADPRPDGAFVVVLPSDYDHARATSRALYAAGCDMLVLNPHFPVIMIYGKAPKQATPELWQTLRGWGANIYAFTAPATP